MWATTLYRMAWIALAGVAAYAFHDPRFLYIALAAFMVRKPKPARLSVQEQFELVQQRLDVLGGQISRVNQQPNKEIKANDKTN